MTPQTDIYLDNAATSWPKPECVAEAMARFLRDVGANPGRGGHRRSNEAEALRLDAREAVAELVGVRDPLRIVFALNATSAINHVLYAMLAPGSHVVCTGVDHNAVMRPLDRLRSMGVRVDVAPCAPDGTLDPAAVAELVRSDTRLIVAPHASNVCGTVLPIRAIGRFARERGVPFLVDASQTIGVWPIYIEGDCVDLLAFTGHKGLLGPTGTGGLAIADAFDVGRLPPFICGGTGSLSEHERQPDLLPDKYEAGTPNVVGLAGLAASARYVLDRGLAAVRAHEEMLARRLIEGLRRIDGVTVHGTLDPLRQTSVVSFNLRGRASSDVAFALDERFGVLCRPGLHCAPRAHRTLGTFPGGSVRFSPGLFTTAAQLDDAIAGVATIAADGRKDGAAGGGSPAGDRTDG